jgi:hypothetical protein
MAVHVFLFFLIFSLALLWRLCWLPLQPSHSPAGNRRTMVHRLLKPRTPLDCPICRLASSSVRPAPAPVRPWREVKSRRGAPKRIPTESFACPNQQCVYFGITDADNHALVGDGRYSNWTWWINRPTLSRPTSGRFLVRRQSREAFSSRSKALSKLFC